MKYLLIVIVLLTIFFFPKAYFIYAQKEGLILDCSCYGMQKDTIGRAWGKNPTTRKLCYGVPIQCITQKISWVEYVKSDWSLVFTLVAEVVLMVAYNIADKSAHKKELSG